MVEKCLTEPRSVRPYNWSVCREEMIMLICTVLTRSHAMLATPSTCFPQVIPAESCWSINHLCEVWNLTIVAVSYTIVLLSLTTVPSGAPSNVTFEYELFG